MASHIQKLNILTERMHSAMRGRIMVEVGRKAQTVNFRVSDKFLAAAERRVEYALSEAERLYPQPTNITLSRVLARHPLTGGMVRFTPEDVLRYIRLQVFKHHPHRREIFGAEREILRGRTVDPKKLKQVQDLFYTLTALQGDAWGIRHDIFGVLDGSFFTCLLQAFPHFGLAREGFEMGNWSTREQSIKNIRFRILRADPGLEQEVLEIEGLIQAKRPVDACRLTRLRAKLLRLRGCGVQSRVGGFRRSGFFADAEDALRQAFPLLKLTARRHFLAEFDLRDPDQVRLLLKLALHKTGIGNLVDPQNWQRVRLEPIDFGHGEVIAFRSIIKRIGRVMREIRLLPPGWRWVFRGAQREFLQGAVIEREATQRKIREELHNLRNQFGYVNEDIVKLNSAWFRRLGRPLFIHLLGMEITDYFKSREFWDK